MSDHNFEKQIQQKLDGFKVPPADTVWSGVAAQIRKDKRRRRGIIFFPVFLLLIAASSYFIFRNNFSKAKEHTSEIPSSKSNTVSNNSTSSSKDINEKLHPNELTNEPTTDKIVDDAKDDQRQTKESPGDQAKKIGNGVDVYDKLQLKNKSIFEKSVGKKYTSINKKIKAAGIEKKGNTEQLSVSKNIDEPKLQLSGIEPKAIESIDSEKFDIPKIPDSQNRKPAIDPTASPLSVSLGSDEIETDKAVGNLIAYISKGKNDPIKIKHSNWKWGIITSAGISNLVDDNFFNGVLGGEKSFVADVSANPNANAPGTGGSGIIMHKPSAIEKGFSFSLGGFVQKTFNKKFSISTGIRYSYYSTHILVGRRIDSVRIVQNAFGALNVNEFYRATPLGSSLSSASPTISQKYTNDYHFLELPISVHMRLNKGRRLPIFWNSGISISYLASTNALHFDSPTGVYYKDNSLFNKFQAHLSTGFSMSLFNSFKKSIDIGPQFQYGLSTLMKGQVSPGKHLYYYGVNAKIFLKK